MSKDRLAIIDHEKCKPTKCNKECQKKCPPQSMGKVCIDIESVAIISESICIGCGLCEKVCPFNAIQIVNLPKELPLHIVHRYGENKFGLYKFPQLQKGKVYGLLGENGTGKSTIVKILSGEILPNFGKLNETLSTNDIIKLSKSRGNEVQTYFKELYKGNLKVVVKPQNIISIQNKLIEQGSNPSVREWILMNVEGDIDQDILRELDISIILLDLKYINISGGEQQKICCAITLMKNADVYIFDEPTNYLDIKQRLKLANKIKNLSDHNKYIIVIEHDMTILDYISDLVYILYGQAGAYGVVSLQYPTGRAINMFFEGFIGPENMYIRKDSLQNKKVEIAYENDVTNNVTNFPYPNIKVEFDGFRLDADAGTFPVKSSLTIIMGENGTGKTTFLRRLLKKLEFKISYKPQYPNLSNIKGDPTVEEFLHNYIGKALNDNMFKSDVMLPFKIKNLYDKKLSELSGGELQKISITYCLGTNAQIYILDEPSASLDIEQRFNTIKVLKRFIAHNNKIGFIVEHDIGMSIALANETNSQLIVFNKFSIDHGIKHCIASPPMGVTDGMNYFLEILDVTFRKSDQNERPKINLKGSSKDNEQKLSKKYYMG